MAIVTSGFPTQKKKAFRLLSVKNHETIRIKVVILKAIDDIDLFCKEAEPILGVFASKKWLSVYGRSLSLIGIYKDEQQLIGGFYFMKTKKYGFTFLKLPPYTPHCALFFKHETSNTASSLSFQKKIIEEVAKYLKKENATLTVLALPSTFIDTQPFIWNNYKVIPNYTYRIDLTQPIEKIISQFDPKKRNSIQKAIKEQVTISMNCLDAKELYDFFSGSLKKAGANVYEYELKNIFTVFSGTNNSFCLTAKLNDMVLANVFCIYDEKVCYYLLGGINTSSEIPGINNILMLKAIEKAKELGCSVFDFEGSMLKGVEKFFRGFGPTLHPYFTINKGRLWLELLLKFKKRAIF